MIEIFTWLKNNYFYFKRKKYKLKKKYDNFGADVIGEKLILYGLTNVNETFLYYTYFHII